MSPQNRPHSSDEALGFLAGLIKQIRLLWRLLNDPRVPAWVKTIPLVALLYLIFPIDLIPDPALGLGQLDDLAIILLGLKLFRDFSPPAVVREHEDEILGKTSLWQVVKDKSGTRQKNQPPYVDAEYKVIDKE